MRVRHPPAKPPRACDSSPAASRASPSRHFGPMRSLARNHTPTMTAPPRDQFFFFFCRRRRLRAIISTDRRPSVGVYLQNVVLSFIRNMYSIHNIVYTYTVVEPRWLDNIGWMSKNKEKKNSSYRGSSVPMYRVQWFFWLREVRKRFLDQSFSIIWFFILTRHFSHHRVTCSVYYIIYVVYTKKLN